MKEKNGLKKGIRIIIYIIYISIVCMACYGVYSIIFKEHNNQKPDDKQEENITLDEDTIEEIITYIPFSSMTLGVYKDIYNGKLTTAKDIPDTLLAISVIGRYQESYTAKNGNTEEIKKLLAKNKLEERTIVHFKDDIDYLLMKRYNNNLDTLNNLSKKVKLTKLNDKYVTIDIETMYPSELTKISSNYNVKTENGNVIITEKVIFMREKDEKCYLYANSNMNSTPLIVFEQNNENINEKVKDYLTDYTSQYKHTFKKNNTGYYWYSTEFVS